MSIDWSRDGRICSTAVGVFLGSSAVVWLCKLHALYASYDVTATFSFMFVAGIAAIASMQELALLGTLCLLFCGRIVIPQDRPTARMVFSVTLLALIFFLLCVNVVDSELIPALGAPLTIPLIQYSDVFGSYYGRAAVLSWVRPELVLLLVASAAIAAASFFASIWAARRFGLRLVIGLVLAFIIPSAFLALTRSPATPNIMESGTLALLRSLPAARYSGLNGHKVVAAPFRLAGQDKGLPKPAAHIRNVILFVIEAGDAQYLDVYGGPYSITPNLSALKSQSLILKNAYAQATSSEVSLKTLLTSRYPPTWMGQSYRTLDLVLLPQLLLKSGMRTGFFHSSDIRFGGTEAFLSAARFGTVHDYRSRKCGGSLFEDPDRDLGNDDKCTLADLMTWIDRDPEHPFFAVIWTFESHYPYFARTPRGLRIDPAVIPLSRARTDFGRYLGALSDADAVLGSLVRELQRKGMFQDTLIVVTGDHGQAFGQHGTYGNGGSVQEESVHVPLILINPGLRPPRTSDRVAGHIDVAPTIADSLGIPVPSTWEGRSLFQSARERPIYFTNMMESQVIGYRLGNRKVFADFVRGSVDIFDLSSDSTERDNLAGNLPEDEVTRQRDWLATWATSVDQRFARQ